MNEQTKQEIKSFSLHYWYLILIILLLIASVVLWQRGESKQKIINEQAAALQVAGTVQAIEAKLAELRKREAELYPELAKKLAQLDKDEAALAKKRKELTNGKREKISKQVDKMDINAVSREFNTMGFANSVTSKP